MNYEADIYEKNKVKNTRLCIWISKKDLKNAYIKVKYGESVAIPTGTITEKTTFELTAYDNNDIVAITGLYSDFDINETNSIWLGWFGVRPEFRRRSIGAEVLNFTIKEAYELAKKYPIKFLRLYTSIDENATAQLLYKKIMDFPEKYNHPKDFTYGSSCLIWTKSLFGDSIIPWNNRYLGLNEIEEQEKKYLDIFMKKYNNGNE